MPLKIIAPREGKSPNYSIRGTYLGKRVDRTSGTPDKATARKVLKRIQEDIERGTFSDKPGPTFAGAALAYLKAGGEDRFLQPLKDHFGATQLAEIDQAAIDNAAFAIYPNADNATRNRQVYTPVSAILKRAGVEFSLHRPIGAQGKMRTNWLWPEQAYKIFDAAHEKDVEFAVLLMVLCYTGLRLEEGLCLLCDNVRLGESYAYVPDTKNRQPRAVFLPPPAVAALANHPRGLDRSGQYVFRFHKSGALYTKLKAVFKKAGVPLGKREGFHLFRHTFGTWMARYGGLDAKGLKDTGTWKDMKSAARYSHAVVSEEAQKAALLPAPTARKA
jgi:integrase